MANEIQAFYSLGYNLYSVVVHPFTGQVWNTSGGAFENGLAADWASYAIVLAPQGSTPLYAGNFPTQITTVASFGYGVFLQSGGSPATSDSIVGRGTVDWNGSAAALQSVLLGAAGLDSVLVESGITPSPALTNDASTQLAAINGRQALALIQSLLAGLLSGAANNAPAFKAVGKPSVTRLAGTTDVNANRNSATIVVPT